MNKKKFVPAFRPGDEGLLEEVFLHLIAETSEPLAELFDVKNEIKEISSWEGKALRRSRIIAHFLIDERGDLKPDELDRLLRLFEQGRELFYPNGFNDSLLMEHFHLVLKKLNNPSFWRLVKKFHMPVCHKKAEELIRDTLHLDAKIKVKDSDVKKAALVACLVPLRQNVGSCFATAPAILTQREEMELMLSDLYELLTTGKLKRTIGGYDYTVPLSPSSGLAHPNRSPTCPLLKAWEFTIASFCDVKREFSKWNLYTSLGMNPEEVGGIGQAVYLYIDEKLKECNEKVDRYQIDYEIAFDQVRATESLLKQAASQADVRRLQAEHMARLYHMRACLDLRDQFHALSTHYANFFTFLYKQLESKIDEYFQEIYDPEMQDIRVKEYADAPAGFRLVYKHGRSDASLWTLIHTKEEYVSCLVDFFLAIEPQIAYELEKKEEKQDLSHLISLLVTHVRTQEFLETAIRRMAKAHEIPFIQNPLADLEKLEKKPWAYISGGTMPTLLKVYFRKENEPKQEARWVESEMDLAIFILDTLKHLPPLYTDPFLKESSRGMFMQSPTHAFILQPGWLPFRQGWQEEIFTYTWVRDQMLLPAKGFYESIKLSSEEQRALCEALSEKLAPDVAHALYRLSPSVASLTPQEFRQHLVEELAPIASKQQELIDTIDSFLYEALPLTEASKWKEAVKDVWQKEDGIDEVLAALPELSYGYLTAKQLKASAKACFLLAKKRVTNQSDLHQQVANRATLLGLASPHPFLFADSNWSESYFGLVVNPGTGKLELWRFDRNGEAGVPLSSWKEWLNGSQKIPWAIFTKI